MGAPGGAGSVLLMWELEAETQEPMVKGWLDAPEARFPGDHLEESLMQKRGQMFRGGALGGGVVLSEAGSAGRLEGHCVTPGSAGRGCHVWPGCGVKPVQNDRQLGARCVCSHRAVPDRHPAVAGRQGTRCSLPAAILGTPGVFLNTVGWAGNAPGAYPSEGHGRRFPPCTEAAPTVSARLLKVPVTLHHPWVDGPLSPEC